MILSFKHHQFLDNCPVIFSMSLLLVSFLPGFFFSQVVLSKPQVVHSGMTEKILLMASCMTFLSKSTDQFYPGKKAVTVITESETSFSSITQRACARRAAK